MCVFLMSAGQMTDLLYTEKELVHSLREYIKAEESKLSEIKRYSAQIIKYPCKENEMMMSWQWQVRTWW